MEAGWRSGSLNTANHALDLERPIGAVPGPVTSSASAGCHQLIRDGNAQLVTSADEMAELAPLSDLAMATSNGMSRERPEITRVLDALSARSARSVPDVAARSGLAEHEVAAVLAALELDGRAEERERGWRRVSSGR